MASIRRNSISVIYRNLVVVLIATLVISCAKSSPAPAVTSPYPPPRTHIYSDSSVSYPMRYEFVSDTFSVSLQGIPRTGLSTMQEALPYTGGNRVIVYASDERGMGADYAIYIWRDSWLLTKDDGYGVYSNFLDSGPVSPLDSFESSNIKISFPRSRFGRVPRRFWNIHMKLLYDQS